MVKNFHYRKMGKTARVVQHKSQLFQHFRKSSKALFYFIQASFISIHFLHDNHMHGHMYR